MIRKNLVYSFQKLWNLKYSITYIQRYSSSQALHKKRFPMQFSEYFSSNHMLPLIIYAQMASITSQPLPDSSITWPCERLAWKCSSIHFLSKNRSLITYIKHFSRNSITLCTSIKMSVSNVYPCNLGSDPQYRSTSIFLIKKVNKIDL